MKELWVMENLKLSEEELKYRKNMLKVVIVNKKIKKFEKLKKEDVSLKRINNPKKKIVSMMQKWYLERN